MVIIVLSGGIGAQLFQYAAGYSIAKKKNSRLILDCCWYSSGNEGVTKPLKLPEIINLKKEVLINNIWFSRLLRTIFKLISIFSFGLISYKRIDIKNPVKLEKFPESSNYFINGYIYNFGYFNNYIHEITKKFNLEKKNNKKIQIGIHIRKGDQKDGIVDFCNADYYRRAVNKIIEKKKLNINNVELLVFCEELEWPKNNIENNGMEIKFVIGDDKTAIRDLKIMMNCDHLVISNSAYSWWAAAYIYKNLDSMIVCPDLWWDRIDVKKINIYPKEWNILETKIEPNENPEYLNL